MKKFTEALVETLTARNNAKPSKDIESAISYAKKAHVAIDALFSTKAFDQIAKRLLASVAVVESKDDEEKFVAVKVLVKIVKASAALSRKLKGNFDPYSQTIIENLISLQQIDNKSALVSLSRDIEYSEFEQVQHLVARYRCSPGTATTQASSTRMMLRALDICEVQKGKKGDVITLKDNDRARALVAVFSKTADESGEETATDTESAISE